MTDTIAAIATPPGSGGVGIVRVSGPRAREIGERMLDARLRPRRVRVGGFLDRDGQPLDHGIALYFAAPASFTGEDVLELQGHGGPVLLNMLLDRCVELGARRARAGEFSERAFLNGKLDLAQAEAIADLIAAGSESAARAALRSLQGAFSARVDALVEQVIRLRVHVEAAIDFAEEEIDFLADAAIAAQLDAVCAAHAELLGEAQHGQRLRDGLHVVIVGPPNAGKSSLLNALAGADRAIVTAAAGTTRDVLREVIRVGNIELTLADTAGLRSDSADVIEQEGMRRARVEQQQADLVLAVIESGDGASEAQLVTELCGRTVLWIENKIDLHGVAAGVSADRPDRIALSARDGRGLDDLRDALARAAGAHEQGAGTFSARARHVDALQRAGTHLSTAEAQLAARHGELLAEELRGVQQVLGEITGAFDADALLGRIFSSFCIGK